MKNFEFLYKNIGQCGSYHYDLYIIHMLQAKLLNVALKYYNKEKNANGWILKNYTHLLVATISKFKLKGKHFKRRALKTYILQGITYKFKNSKFSAFSELVKSQKSCWSPHFPHTMTSLLIYSTDWVSTKCLTPCIQWWKHSLAFLHWIFQIW